MAQANTIFGDDKDPFFNTGAGSGLGPGSGPDAFYGIGSPAGGEYRTENAGLGQGIPPPKPPSSYNPANAQAYLNPPSTSGAEKYPVPVSIFGAGGVGSSGGGGFGTTSFTHGPTPFDDEGINHLIAEKLKQFDSPYSPEVMESGKAELAGVEAGRRKAAEDAIKVDQTRRGMLRSGATGRRLDTARAESDQRYGSGVNALVQKKAETDFGAKMANLQAMQGWLNSLRDYNQKSDLTQLERDKANANIELAMMNLNAEQSRLQQTLGAQWDIANLNRTPREGVDFIYMDDGHGNRVPVPLSALQFGTGWLS